MDVDKIGEHKLMSHFQRVSVSGDDTSGVPLDDLEHDSNLIIEALELREHYMNLSMQSFPQTTERYLKLKHNKTMSDGSEYEEKRSVSGN